VPYPVPNQIELPFKVAMEIVMQGFRIRFGRSLVTVFGVLLGIMFLMATLTTFLLKRGVADEDRLRLAARQMANYLEAEIGSVRDRTLAVIEVGPLSETENRLMIRLIRQGAKTLIWTGPEAPPPALASLPVVKAGALEDAAKEPKAFLVLGGETIPAEMQKSLADLGVERPVAFTRVASDALPRDTKLHLVSLSGKPDPEDLQRQSAERRAALYRLVWIVIIALLVTIMGISNAILMSVTERFREIGTMKCLGAGSRFIRRIFLIESSLIGVVGGLAGAILGALFSFLFHGAVYGFGLVIASLPLGWILLSLAACMAVGVLLSVLAALYPASVASAMVPATALRSNV